jgi:hypothetical protein
MPFSLISATVLRTRPIGVTPDYCPVCRRERRFRLAQAEYRRYFMCMDRGRHGHPHHELTCMTCDCRVERPVEERPIAILPDPKSADFFEPELLPIVQSRIDNCSAMEQARKDDKLNTKQREEMIRHALYSFARVYDEETFERLSPVARLLIAIFALAVAIGGYYAWTQTGSWYAPALAALALLLGFLTLVYWIARQSPRKRVQLWLAQALCPLDPTSSEIRQARAELQGSRMKAGFQIRTDRVLARIKKLKAKKFGCEPKPPY